ncbi:MAG: hypothetical protein IIC86_05755, partial [Chloroflexi bacterium]|nr:hypothetical protein [Chloroflexota bacterium]
MAVLSRLGFNRSGQSFYYFSGGIHHTFPDDRLVDLGFQEEGGLGGREAAGKQMEYWLSQL